MEILIIGGIHGNEISPAKYLSTFKPTNDFLKANYTVIPIASIDAALKGVRYIDIDPNRSFGLGVSPVCENLEPFIHNADLIIDFHEALNDYPIGLGGTVSCITPNFTKYVGESVKRLNSNYGLNFKHIDKLPYVGSGSLDDYCLKHKKNYILVELLGQGNRTYDEIADEARMVLHSLLRGGKASP